MKYFKIDNTHITFIGSFHDFIQERYRCEATDDIKYALYTHGINHGHMSRLLASCRVKFPYCILPAVQKLQLINIYYLLNNLKNSHEVCYLGV